MLRIQRDIERLGEFFRVVNSVLGKQRQNADAHLIAHRPLDIEIRLKQKETGLREEPGRVSTLGLERVRTVW